MIPERCRQQLCLELYWVIGEHLSLEEDCKFGHQIHVYYLQDDTQITTASGDQIECSDEQIRCQELAGVSTFYLAVYSEIEEVGWEHLVRFGADLTSLSFQILDTDSSTDSQVPFLPSIEVSVKALLVVSSAALPATPSVSMRVLLCGHHPDLVGTAKKMRFGGKLGERVMPLIIHILSQGLKDSDTSRRQGVCIGLSEVMASAAKSHLLSFMDELIRPFTLLFLIACLKFVRVMEYHLALCTRMLESKRLMKLFLVFCMCRRILKPLTLHLTVPSKF